MKNGFIAQTVLISSLLTLVLVAGVAYLTKDRITEYLTSSVRSELSTQLQEPATKRTVIETVEDRVVDTIAEANPAVVSIVVTKDVPVYERYYEQFDPFGGFFGGFSVPRVREQGTEEREVGGGSGFIVSADGLVVTNRHVVADPSAQYTAVLSDGANATATVVARDPVLDIAILQIESADDRSFPYLEFGDSRSLQVGQTVIAIGNALAEFDNSVSSGIVSGLSRSIIAGDGRGMNERLDEVIQTDAAINPGNSGGPLLDLQGRVIGVNVAVSRGAENIGFALPAHAVEQVVRSVQEHGEIVRPYLGVRYTMITPRMVELNDLPVEYGALIIRGETADELAVVPGSPAAAAGLTEGDIILSIDGVSLQDTSLAQAIRGLPVGEPISVRIFRDDEEITQSVVLEQRNVE